jgi:predicted alpha/beta hydrolase family esterase
MTKQVLFIQGAGEGAYAADELLADSLRRELGSGYEVRYPRMPNEDEPDDNAWSEVIARDLSQMGVGAILVGHSAGAVTLVMFLAQRSIPHRIAALFLIGAPYFGDSGWRVEGFEMPKDFGKRLPDAPVFLFHGTEDETVPIAHLDLYARAIPHAVVRRLEGRDHQLNNSLSEVAADIIRLR